MLTVADLRHSDEHHLPTKTPRSTEHHLHPHTSVTQITRSPSPAQSKRTNLPRKISLSPVLSFKSNKSKSTATSIVSTSGSSAVYDDVAADDERDGSSKREDSSGSGGSFFSWLLLRRSSKKSKKNASDEAESSDSVASGDQHEYDDVATVEPVATPMETVKEELPEVPPQKVPRYHQSQAFINGSLTAAALRNSTMFRQRIEPLNLPVAESLSSTRISVNMSSDNSSVSPISSVSSYSGNSSALNSSISAHGLSTGSITSPAYSVATTSAAVTVGTSISSSTLGARAVTTSCSAYSVSTTSSTSSTSVVDLKDRTSVQKSHSFRTTDTANKLPYSRVEDPSPSLPANVGLVDAEVHAYDDVADEVSGFKDDERLGGAEGGAYEAVNLQVETKKEVVEVPAYTNVSVLNTLNINVNERPEGSTSSSADEATDMAAKLTQVRVVKLL